MWIGMDIERPAFEPSGSLRSQHEAQILALAPTDPEVNASTVIKTHLGEVAPTRVRLSESLSIYETQPQLTLLNHVASTPGEG